LRETQVTVWRKDYRWTEADGLDPEAVLEIQHWIKNIAKRHYLRKATALNIDLEDLIQAGTIGALKAARTYEPVHNRTFLSWATPKIHTELWALCKHEVAYNLPESAEGQPDTVTSCDAAIEVSQILAKLPRRDQRMLTDYYGISTDSKTTLAALGKKWRVSRQRAYQLINWALVRARLEMEKCQRK